MSNETSELQRSVKSIEAYLGGIWDEIGRLTDWFYELERRVTKLEKKPKDISFHPRKD